MIFVEVIANPSMAMPDLVEVIKLAQKKKILCFVDATFASPICVQPIVLGADFCMHSWYVVSFKRSDILKTSRKCSDRYMYDVPPTYLKTSKTT
ncbi:hypothetical protein ANCCEY_11720 [Ancylostoma ceylanicum]|uniref:Uncharacterized protein n=1 Tax=Ancylostoma ceylanicum TaxID=53326 RepID=A0A0D6LAU6_9BILA|nr:hypothetical protein ANCCEY_11720 [Ancylostoma ceylanicum]